MVHWRHLVQGLRASRVLLLAASVALVSVSFAVASHQRNVSLRPGENYTFYDRFRGDVVVQCESGHGNPGWPGHPGGPGHGGPGHGGPGHGGPGNPPAPICSTFDFDSKLQRLSFRRDLLARGECGYGRVDGYMGCEGVLDRFEVQAQKEAFARDVIELKNTVEQACRTRTCAQIEISRVLRDYEFFVNSVQMAQIIVERFQRIPLVDFPQNLRANCSGW